MGAYTDVSLPDVDVTFELSCCLTSVQQQFNSSSPPDSECHGVVATLDHRLQPLPDELWAAESLTFDPALALKDKTTSRHDEPWCLFIGEEMYLVVFLVVKG